MSKTNLPDEIREKVMQLASKGYRTNEIADEIRDEGLKYVDNDEAKLRRSISSIIGHYTQGHKPKKSWSAD